MAGGRGGGQAAAAGGAAGPGPGGAARGVAGRGGGGPSHATAAGKAGGGRGQEAGGGPAFTDLQPRRGGSCPRMGNDGKPGANTHKKRKMKTINDFLDKVHDRPDGGNAAM